jgi:hypothetical protein
MVRRLGNGSGWCIDKVETQVLESEVDCAMDTEHAGRLAVVPRTAPIGSDVEPLAQIVLDTLTSTSLPFAASLKV